MAYISFQPNDYFSTKLFTGDASSNRGITGVGFQPDWVWFKTRNSRANSHVWVDAARGVGQRLRCDSGAAQASVSGEFISFDSDGFTVTGGGANELNYNSVNYVTWNWRAGGGAGSSNTDGSINTTTTSVNTTSGFSVSTYTGTGSTATIGHGLGAVPDWIIVKRLDASSTWRVYHSALGATKNLTFETGAALTQSSVWNDTSPTSSVFTIGNAGDVNTSSSTYVAYCFTEKKGFSKFGKYTGNNNSNGQFVYCGFSPNFIIQKQSGGSAQYQMRDGQRGFNGEMKTLYTDSHEVETSGDTFDIVSNGFKIRNNSVAQNGAEEYVFMAFAENPLVSSNGVPTCAR